MNIHNALISLVLFSSSSVLAMQSPKQLSPKILSLAALANPNNLSPRTKYFLTTGLQINQFDDLSQAPSQQTLQDLQQKLLALRLLQHQNAPHGEAEDAQADKESQQ